MKQLGWAVSGLALFILLGSAANAANEPADFDVAAFAKAQAEGGTIVIESYAYWCLACRIQAPILDDLINHAPFDSVTVFRIGETTTGRVWKQLHLSNYGTLIVFKGREEVSRGTPTTETTVATLIHRGL
ncbi:MAG: thioredoxin family protein [Sphingomonadales bacterium]|nr:thioredoxin family protein [Sphingomonadales bacterium]